MAKLTDVLGRFDSLPDSAVVHCKVSAALTGLSERTIRYDPRFERVYLTKTRYGNRVGQIRKVLAGLSKGELGG
jgi:hypothetical protein